MPLPIFEDIIMVETDLRKEIDVDIDPVFIDVCEKDSINVISVAGDSPCPIGASVQGNTISIQISQHYTSPAKIVLKIAGIRKGSTVRFPKYSEQDALNNSKFWDSWKK